MDAYFALVTVLVSGLFGLLVAWVTGRMAHRREVALSSRLIARDRIDLKRNVFSRQLSVLEKSIRLTNRLENYSVLDEELSFVNAQLLLIGNMTIVTQSERVGDLLYEWSTEVRKGSPLRGPDSTIAVFNPMQKTHQVNATEIFPKLNQAILELAALMRTELETDQATSK